MSGPERFELTSAEKHSSQWARLQAHMVSKLDELRIRNDAITLTEQETAVLRGQIKCLRGLIELGADRPLTGE